MNKLIPIGTAESISFPDQQISDVPAKVDTGADGSSIWASNIVMKNGALSFHFFAPGSVFYREQSVTTTDFKTTNVKNSFGHEEFRFKIRVKVKVGLTVISRWFSLADRSNNTYPVLLGKNVLKNRFVVDVSKKHLLKGEPSSPRVLVLGSKGEEMTDFLRNVGGYHKQKIDYQCNNYDGLTYTLQANDPKIINTLDHNRDISDYAFVYFKSHKRNSEFATTAAEYLKYKSRAFTDKEVSSYISRSKLSEYMKLVCVGLPIPRTICAKSVILKGQFNYLKNSLGMPFVLKEIASDMGKKNYLIQTATEFNHILQSSETDEVYLAQEYIQNDGFYRAYIFDKEVGLVIRRTPTAHRNTLKEHLNKPQNSKNASLVDIDNLPGEVQDISVRAANCLNRQVAGVDIVQDKRTKKWYILEVNNSPQIRGGSFIDNKAQVFAKYIEREVGK